MTPKNETPSVFSSWKLLLPITLGFGVVVWLLCKEFDADSYAKIVWRGETFFFLAIAVLLTAVRIWAYCWRMRTLTNEELSWKQVFQIVGLWEFGSAVTPSMVGGTTVGLFLLYRSGMKLGKAAAIIFATVLIDSLFFLATLILFWLWYGNYVLSSDFPPGSTSGLLGDNPWMYAFVAAFWLMCSYTLLIGLGLFVVPNGVRRLLEDLSKVPFFRRKQAGILQFSKDMTTASKELKEVPPIFWIKGFTATAIAWSSRFLVVVFVIAAFVPVTQYMLLYGRQLSLYLILFLTPTPGGSGVADFAFKDFYFEFIGDGGLATLIGFIWRLLSYYPFLFLGLFLLPSLADRNKEEPSSEVVG